MSTLHNSSFRANAGGWKTSKVPGCDVRTSAIAVIKVGFILGLFYLVGRWVGSPTSARDSAFLAVAILLVSRSLFSQAVSLSLPFSVWFYVAGAFLLQAGAATVSTAPRLKDRHHSKQSQPPLFRALVFPCRTTHTRLFPSKHSFSYSYLFVGIPIGWEGTAGTLLSVGGSVDTKGWFTVSANDYLARGEHRDGLRGKLKDYLSAQGVTADRYPYAYLVTAPRFLGFSFNPISFWYLYDHTTNLSAMILEVNNTFDERRMYFMERRLDNPKTILSEDFSNSWSKDFHVSPFNDREGSYSLTAKNFLIQENHMLDNNIVLRDVNGTAKLVARVFSTELGIDPSRLSVIKTLKFLAKWWWVGLMTNPRILKEARILWIKKLQVYYRPEVFKTSIGRNETTEEQRLEPCFRAFLAELVHSQDEPTVISYQPAAGPNRGNLLRLQPGLDTSATVASRSLDIHVLTPAFYTELVRGSTIERTFTRFCFQPIDNEAMIYVSDHCLLQRLLQDHASKHTASVPAVWLSSSRQLAVSYLRVLYIRDFLTFRLGELLGRLQNSAHPSEFDVFVGLSHSRSAYKAYVGTAAALLLTDQIAFGFGWLLNLYRRTARLFCLAQMSRAVEFLCRQDWSAGTLLSLSLYALIFHGVKVVLDLS